MGFKPSGSDPMRAKMLLSCANVILVPFDPVKELGYYIIIMVFE